MITALLMFSVFSARAAQAPDFTVTMVSGRTGLSVTAVPPKGHHINVEAPMQLEATESHERFKPASADPSLVEFKLDDRTVQDLVVRLYLCDDAKTFCEKHEVAMVGGKLSKRPLQITKVAPAPVAAEPAHKPETVKRELGFIVNAPEAALAEAARRKAPLLIDFFGIWCPPCNMLDETVFPTKEFATATAGFVKLKLDADSPVSWALKARYHVLGYPTVVLASPEGDEISRIVGYRPRADFLKEVAKGWQARNEPYSTLKRKADSGDAAAAFRVGQTHLERGEYDVARTYLEKAAGQPEADVALLDAEIGAAESSPADQFAEILKRAIRAHPESVDAVDWRAKLADAYSTMGKTEESRTALTELVRSVDELVTHPERLAGHDALPADLLELAGDAQEKLGPPEKAKAAWLRAAEAYRVGVKGSAERGFNLELAYCLGKAGDTAAAEKIYSGLERKFPREFTFFFGHARLLVGLKKEALARPLAQKAYEFSYGDNRLRAAELLAKAYAGEGNKGEGLRIIRATLASTPIPTDATIRTNRYAERLRQLEKSLAPEGN